MTPAEYLAAEVNACRSMPPDLVAAFRPVAFQAIAPQYCRPVERMDQLAPFVDAMHQGTDRIWRNLGGALTDEEVRLSGRVLARVAAVTTQLFGKAITPRDALLQAIVQLRAIRRLAPRSVYELGPGSGYLGALLQELGVDYSAFEITQPFYLWQGELLGRDLPWWEQLDGWPSLGDLIVANHMLNEMHETALHMLIDRARCPLLVEGWGSTELRPLKITRGMFTKAGWQIVQLALNTHDNLYIDLLLPPQAKRTTPRDAVERLWKC